MRSKTLCVAIVAAVATSGMTAQLATATTKTIPKAELIKRGDAICRRGDRGLTLSPPAGDPTVSAAALRKFAPFLRQQLHVNAREVRRIAALGLPDRDRAAFQHAIALARRMLKAVRQEVAAAQAGDLKAFLRAARHDSGQAASRELARFGFRACGQ
jgi:hypothetical protein